MTLVTRSSNPSSILSLGGLAPRNWLLLSVALVAALSCGEVVELGSLEGGLGADAATCEVACQSHIYACGDCVDNDSDGLVDSMDPDCLGPCHNAEDTFSSAIPGGTSNKCDRDCYFDQDAGYGNDECLWTLVCDPLEVEPSFYPGGPSCGYDPETTVTHLGEVKGCADLLAQSAECGNVCGPLTPNGCDCFGCCTIPGAPTPVWLGSTLEDGTPSCDLTSVADPTRCHPCTQVASCLNPCEECELCIGKRDVPVDCVPEVDAGPIEEEQCPAGVQPCGLRNQAPCPSGQYCITGCCIETVR
jgi:hypothetical protein